ncbi:CD1375 family protein, partial [Streptococcus porci]|uniref:CD1375 family protein n=1 Tax=Streptococcus porci TaxID=502567 RepID=UPI003CCC1363
MKTLLKQLSQRLNSLTEHLERGIDMMTKLYAINIVAGRYPFSKVPRVLKQGVKEQIALMVEDEELVAELTK